MAEFFRCDFELAHLFGTKKFLAKIDYKPPEAKILAEGPIDEPMLGYVYLENKTNKKDFFRFLDKHLVPSKALQKVITNASKSDSPEHVKNQFINQLQWYIEVRNWIYRAYVFNNEESN